ncbi:MAG: NAD(P)-binding domain-containing protein [Nitrososphaerota archaeon]|jgi:predicted dinucleotide-binding enzyme|nr:NAD(P)-binding domain-containing protein [Nitrososphaerota archaeon]MDG6916896.1 NAD(P)-binding domain-containing protein [Nitrososphaerota archaeon]MDG6919021.1 NAD(P)-binding domain-containing protein [Nitrososphaerota archaeon]
MKPKVGIIGKGNVGSAIKRGLEKAGYQVRAVGRDPKEVGETAKWAELVVLAVPFQAIDEALKAMGDGIVGKPLVDVTNLYTPEMMAAVGSRSGAEELQRKAAGAKVVKAFNTHFAKNMETGRIGEQQLTFLAAGDDREAKAKVLGLGRDLGFDAVDAGPLANSKLLESLGNLNIQLGYSLGLGTGIGFRLVRT